jgi:hypothetical protein
MSDRYAEEPRVVRLGEAAAVQLQVKDEEESETLAAFLLD